MALPRAIVFALMAVFSLTAALLFLGCTGDTPTSVNRQHVAVDPLDLTPRDNAEAENVALWLSGELVAPQDLYEEVRDGLAQLRAEYGDTLPEPMGFTGKCWKAGFIAGLLTEAASIEIRNGTYTEMDSLNEALRLSRMDTLYFGFFPRQVYFQLSFEGRLNPDRLIEMYDVLPSVEIVDYGYGCIGDWSQYYPLLIDGGIGYLFRLAWGDCPAGCIWSEFWYFRVVDLHVEYVGHWDPQTEPAPTWWAEAKKGFCDVRGGRYCLE